MKQDSQDSSPQHDDDERPAAASHGSHRVGTLREFLVRETLSDLENRLTADHHLSEEVAEPGAARGEEPADPTDSR